MIYISLYIIFELSKTIIDTCLIFGTIVQQLVWSRYAYVHHLVAMYVKSAFAKMALFILHLFCLTA